MDTSEAGDSSSTEPVLSEEAQQAAVTAAKALATAPTGLFSVLKESGRAALLSLLSAFRGGKEFVSGTAAVFAELVNDLAQVNRRVFESFDKVYESIIKATYGFFLNPLITGAPLPTLREGNVYGAFGSDVFAYKDVFDPAVTGDDTVKRSQLRNLIRRFVYQARVIVQLVHGKVLDDYDADNVKGAQEVLDAIIKAFKRAAGNEYAYYAYFAEILIALRVALTFSFALIATIQRSEADGSIEYRDVIDEVEFQGEVVETVDRIYFNFSKILRKTIKEYKLQSLSTYITKRARKPIVNPIRDSGDEIYLGVFNALAPTLNSINDTLGNLGVVERETQDVELLVTDDRPTDLKPNALAAQLVHILNFHAAYAPRSDLVVENYVLPAYQDVEFVFDGSVVVSDPNTPLIRAFVFIEASMVEDWSLFCRTTGFLRVPDLNVEGTRPTNRNDTEYPSQLPNDFDSAGTYWRSATMAIEAFTQFATRENALSVLNAFTAIQSFHAKIPLPNITNVLTQTTVFAAEAPVQDETVEGEYAIWRTAKTYKALNDQGQPVRRQFNAPAYIPARELVYLTCKGLFESLFHQPSPYRPDGFELRRFERQSMFLNSESVPLLVQTVACTMYQLTLLTLIDTSTTNDLLFETQELMVRTTIPYSPQNRQSLSLDRQAFSRATQRILEEATLYDPVNRSLYKVSFTIARTETGAVLLWRLGRSIVDAVLISSVVKKQKLVYPPACADLCVAWLRLYSMAFGLYTRETQGATPAVAFLELKLDNRDGEVEDLLTAMNQAYEQLEAIKSLLDPKQRKAREATRLLQDATSDYQTALVEYYAHPTSGNVSDLSFAAQSLVDLLQASESIYTEPTDAQDDLKSLFEAYRTLLADPIPSLAQLEAVEARLREKLREIAQTDANANLVQAMANAREMLWSYFDAVKISLPKC